MIRMDVGTYVLNIQNLSDPLESGQLPDGSKLPDARIQQLKRYRNVQARKQCYGAGWLLSYCLSELNYPEEWVASYDYAEGGKPYLRKMPEFPFSISHSAHMVMVTILELPYQLYLVDSRECMNRNLGCDIERIEFHKTKQQEQIARRFFTKKEYESLCALSEQDAAFEFGRYWTRKESVLKLIGTGMALPMNLFDVSESKEAVIDKDGVEQWFGSLSDSKKKQYLQAVELLLHKNLYFQDYKHEDFCICTCMTEKCKKKLVMQSWV